MTLPREPLAVREGTDTVLVRESVPASVVNALLAWIFETVKSDEDEAEHALIRLDLVVTGAYSTTGRSWRSTRPDRPSWTGSTRPGRPPSRRGSPRPRRRP